MNIKRLVVGIVILIIAFIMGCSGNYANIKNQSGDESKVTQKKLINNWSDYSIWFRYTVIVFDPKNDDKKILVGSYWGTVKDQETWTQLVNGTAPTGFRINRVWGNEIREIWIPDNQFYGYVTHQPNELVNAQIVDENTVRLFHNSNTDRRVWD